MLQLLSILQMKRWVEAMVCSHPPAPAKPGQNLEHASVRAQGRNGRTVHDVAGTRPHVASHSLADGDSLTAPK
jgi:uncharacterized protein YecE (DUF72 family)